MLLSIGRVLFNQRNAGFCPGAAFLLLLLVYEVPIHSAEPPAAYTRICASCGILGADSCLSESGQFVVHGNNTPRIPLLATETDLVLLEPQLTAVTAERVRRAFLQEIGVPDSHQGKVHVIVLDLAPPRQWVGIVSHVHLDGIHYKVSVPSRIEPTQFIKGLVQVLLLEYANRGVRRSAEVPTWIVEGMTRQLLTRISPAYVLNRRPLTIETAGYDRLRSTRQYLQTNNLMSIQELSFPDFSKMSSDERERYEASAHLLVYKLLRLPGGPALMARFIQGLPHSLNWQTAMLQIYRDHFKTPLELEKWWMLNGLDFRQRHERENWPLDVTLQKLDTLLLTSMEVRLDTNTIPQRNEVSLQEVISTTEYGRHKEILSHKLQQLTFLSLRAAPDALELWNAYQQTLESYLHKRALLEYQPALRSDPEKRVQHLVRGTTALLDQLDLARLLKARGSVEGGASASIADRSGFRE